jgi:uncharacterized hydrophobic protein (TIGR00271 family)
MSQDDTTTKGPAGPPHAGHPLALLQDRIAAAFGIRPADREAIVQAMLERSGRESAGYWLQLLLAMGIASLGLVLGSTAVVIGAMLISPLMSPIIELGMGLAIGSPFLVLRSSMRTGVSVVVVVASASLLTLALPFSEVTSEIAARTSPTVLDLFIASFCAIAAAYTTVRPGSDTTSTAAGTAIGIALVPPLCVVGFGVGTGSRAIASGAGLLFVANLCAIILFAVLCFIFLGYSAVSTAALERAELERHGEGTIRRFVLALQVFFGLRYGRLFRVLMPLVLLGAVYLPLRKALSEVTWQVRARAAIERMLNELPQSTVRSSVVVEGRAVSVKLVTVGRAESAAKLEDDLREKIAAASGVIPSVQVIAVPDMTALHEATAMVKASAASVAVVQKEADVALLRERLAQALSRAWPAEAGPLLRWRVEFPEGAPIIVEAIHAGAPLGAAGAALLGKELSRDLNTPAVVRDVPLSLEPVTAEPEAGLAWLPRAVKMLDAASALTAMFVCVEVPTGLKGAALREADAAVAALRGLPAFEAGRMRLAQGPLWRAVASIEPCDRPSEAPPPADALPDAGASKVNRPAR